MPGDEERDEPTDKPEKRSRPMGGGTFSIKKEELRMQAAAVEAKARADAEQARLEAETEKERIRLDGEKHEDTTQLELARIHSEERKSQYRLLGRVILAFLACSAMGLAAYWATQGVKTSVKHEGTEVEISGSQ